MSFSKVFPENKVEIIFQFCVFFFFTLTAIFPFFSRINKKNISAIFGYFFFPLFCWSIHTPMHPCIDFLIIALLFSATRFLSSNKNVSGSFFWKTYWSIYLSFFCSEHLRLTFFDAARVSIFLFSLKNILTSHLDFFSIVYYFLGYIPFFFFCYSHILSQSRISRSDNIHKKSPNVWMWDDSV